MTIKRLSLREAINAKCKACIYDPASRGAWREQVADCAGSNCALHYVRPVPRHCMVDGEIDRAAVAALRHKLTQTATGVTATFCPLKPTKGSPDHSGLQGAHSAPHFAS